MKLFGDVLFEADEMVAEFVRERIACMDKPFANYVALGVVRNNELAGGIVYHDNTCHDIMASAAFTTLRWWNPETVKTLFAYPFLTNGNVRVTVKTAASNHRTRSIVERLGFKQEGVQRLGINGTEDAILYGMLRNECTWLKDT